MLLYLLKDFDHDGQKFLKDEQVEIADETFAKSLTDGDNPTAITPEKYEERLRETVRKQTESEAAKRVKITVTKVRDRRLDDPWYGFKDFGEFARVVKATGQPGTGLFDERIALMSKSITGMGEVIDSDGAVLIPQVANQQIRERVYADGNLIALSEQLTTTGNSLDLFANAETSRATGSRQGGIRAYHMDEADQYTKSKPKFRKMTLKLHKIGALAYTTDEMMDDSFVGLGEYLSAVGNELAFTITDDLIRGNGANAALGILNSPALVTVSKENGQGAATINAENIDNMYARMWSPSWPRATWYINQSIIPQLFSLKRVVGTGGIPAYMPPGGLSASPYGMLLGRPIQPLEQCEALGTVGDIILADFSQYVSISKGGVQAAFSIHLRFDYGEQVWRFTVRMDAQPWWDAPLTPYKDTTKTLSPFVVLATR